MEGAVILRQFKIESCVLPNMAMPIDLAHLVVECSLIPLMCDLVTLPSMAYAEDQYVHLYVPPWKLSEGAFEVS